MEAYEQRFGSEVWQDWPQLGELIDLGIASDEGRTIRLTDVGLEWSDAIGPWLYSAQMRMRMESYELR